MIRNKIDKEVGTYISDFFYNVYCYFFHKTNEK